MDATGPLPFPRCDLRRHPPRGPREQIAGLMLLARTADTVRAQSQGTLGDYRVEPVVADLSELLGLAEVELVAAIRAARDDEALAEWITAHCNTTTFGAINRRLLDAGVIESIEAGA